MNTPHDTAVVVNSESRVIVSDLGPGELFRLVEPPLAFTHDVLQKVVAAHGRKVYYLNIRTGFIYEANSTMEVIPEPYTTKVTINNKSPF